MPTEKAIKTRIEMGKTTDQRLLEYLGEHPDKTIYELKKELSWSVGKIQKSLKHLEGKVTVTQEVGEGRIRKKYQVSNKKNI